MLKLKIWKYAEQACRQPQETRGSVAVADLYADCSRMIIPLPKWRASGSLAINPGSKKLIVCTLVCHFLTIIFDGWLSCCVLIALFN